MRRQDGSKRIYLLLPVMIVSGMFIFFLIWHSPKRTTLVSLQKAMLIAKTENDRQKVLNRLDQYYLTLSIPDSLRHHVENDVDILIWQQEKNLPSFNLSIPDTNVYVLENQLKDILREAMIARCRIDETTTLALLSFAAVLADTVDIGTQNRYWKPWVAKIVTLDRDMARTWLAADRAERLCTRYHGYDFLTAEQYGALGLQYLQQIEDERILQDIYQRLLIILYQDRGLYDLSYPCLKRGIQQAEQIKYQLRATGFIFHSASALLFAGRNTAASEMYWLTIHHAERFSHIPDMDWYYISGYLGIANTNRRLGKYQEALSIADRIEAKKLDIGQQISLHLSKGICHVYLGDYDTAGKEYEQSLNLAIQAHDLKNQVITLRNLGVLYFRLTEYEKACNYYKKAITILEESCPDNIEQKCRLFINLAEIKVEQGKIDSCKYWIQKTDIFIRNLDLPTVTGEMLKSLGRLNLKLGEFSQAHRLFKQAVVLYEKNGLFRESLEVKNEIAASLIKLKDFKKAKNLLEETYTLAVETQDCEHKIEAIGMMAEIADTEGNLQTAVQKSNQMIKEIESVSAKFSNTDNLIFYRQKIYDYLKNAVVYEIKQNRVDSAFTKLDYIKARVSKSKLKKIDDFASHSGSYLVNIDSLKTRLTLGQLIIDYFIARDTLYAFVMDSENLHLLKHAIHDDEIEKTAHQFLSALYASPHVFQNHQLSNIDSQYISLTRSSQQLYQILFGWPELQEYFKTTDVTYIIPDGILYALPFHCLMDDSGEKPRFLIQQTAVVNLPSATFLLPPQKKKTTFSIHENKALISADRSFPGAETIIASIKKYFPLSEELTTKNLTIHKQDILSELNQKFDLYFFLGHSVADTLMPDSSYFNLAVTKPAGQQTSVKITLADLKRIDWSNAEMVCLIGCETAKGKIYRGSGLAGIQQSILMSGAKQVLASYWQIDARMAIAQMSEFLKKWSQSQSSAEALQSVQIQAIQDLDGDRYFRKPHPFLWGSFILSQTIQ